MPTISRLGHIINSLAQHVSQDTWETELFPFAWADMYQRTLVQIQGPSYLDHLVDPWPFDPIFMGM